MSRKRSRAGGTVPDATVLQFEHPPLDSLSCTICFELFGNNHREPVTLTVCGHSFCRRCATSSLTAKRQCPNCRKECARTGAVDSLVIPNFTAKDALDELRVHCRFGLRADGADGWEKDPEGCPALVKRGDKVAHEQKCEHRRLQCRYIDSATVPNSVLWFVALSGSCGGRERNARTNASIASWESIKKSASSCQWRVALQGVIVSQASHGWRTTGSSASTALGHVQTSVGRK